MKLKIKKLINKFKGLLQNPKIEENKLYIIIALVVLLTVSLLTTVYLVSNHNKFLKLNQAMEEVFISPYDENNLLIKGKTLDNMESEIVASIDEFSKWYDENIVLSKENLEKRKSLLKSDGKKEEKFDDILKIYLDDLAAKNKTLKSEVEKLLKSDVAFNSSEASNIKKYNGELASLSDPKDIKESIDVYESLKKIKNNTNKTIDTAKKRIKKEEEEKKAKEEAEKLAAKTGNYSNVPLSPTQMEGDFNRSLATDLFNAINSYRASIGKAPYVYNSAKQGCIDQEALAYANTSNPHNWVCDNLNENASTAAVGSNLVALSMNFFINDAPHEEVLAGRRYNYTSAAVSVVQKNGTYYAIVGVWL